MIVRKMAADGVVVVHHPVNRGKGAAMGSGLRHAPATSSWCEDADLEYDPRDYAEIVERD